MSLQDEWDKAQPIPLADEWAKATPIMTRKPLRPPRVQEQPNPLEEAFAPLGEGNIGGFKGDWLEATKGVLKTAPLQIASGVLGFISMLDEAGLPTGTESVIPIGKYAKEAATYFQGLASEKAPDLGKGTPEYYYYAALTSTLQNLPSLAAGFATGSQALALFSMGAQVAGNKYTELVNQGESREKASIAAGAYGIAEAIGEKIPLHFLMKNKGLRAMLLSSFSEMPGELTTEVLQAGIDYGILDENMTFAEFKDRLKETAIVTAISAPMTAGLGRGIAHTVMATMKGQQPTAQVAPKEPVSPLTPTPTPTEAPTEPTEAVDGATAAMQPTEETIEQLAERDDTLTPEEETRYREWLREQGVESENVDLSVRRESSEAIDKLNSEWGSSLKTDQYIGYRASEFGNELNKMEGPNETGTEGRGQYIAKTPDTAAFFGTPKEVKFDKPENPLLVQDEPLYILQEDEADAIFEPLSNDDSPWLRAHKLAVQAVGITDQTWSEKLSELQDELTRQLFDAGYDSVYVSSGGEEWIVLLDKSFSRGVGQTIISAVDHITALAAQSSINLNPIIHATDITIVDPRTDRARAEAMGISKEEIDAAIEAGHIFRVFGRHDLTYSEDGQVWSTITLFPGATVEDFYHEFAHAADRQGKLANIEGSPEEKARFVAKEMAAGRATSLEDFVKEGMKTGPPSTSPVTDFSARMDEAIRKWQTYKAWKEAHTDTKVKLTEQDITDLERLADETSLETFMEMLGEVKGKPSVIWKESGLAKSAIDFYQTVNRYKRTMHHGRQIQGKYLELKGFINEDTGEVYDDAVRRASVVELEEIAERLRAIRESMQRRLAAQEEGQDQYRTMKRNIERAKVNRERVKSLIRRATNQVKVDSFVRESDALNAAFQKAQRASRVAFREGKKAGIDEMKYLQMVKANRERFLREVRALRRSIENTVKRAEKGRLEPEYRDAVRGIADGTLDLAAFIAEREKVGDILFIPEDDVQAYTDMNPADMTLGDLRNIESLVRMMAYQGRKFRQIVEYGKAVSLADRIEEIKNSIIDKFRIILADPQGKAEAPSGRRMSRYQKVADTVEGLTMQLKKVEYITDWLDGFEKLGVVWRSVFKPMVEAERVSLKRGNRIAADLNNAVALIKDDIKSIREDRTIVLDDGRLLTHEEAIMVALNAGNAGNLQRLTDSALQYTEKDLEGIVASLTPNEKAFVERIFDLVESQRDEIAAVYRELTGERMKFVEGRYFPIITDKDISRMGDRRELEKDLMKENFYRSAVGRGFTISRVGGTDAPLLSLDVIARHLTDTNHFVSHAVAVRDVQKILLNPTFKEAVTMSVGRNAYDQFLPWLKSVANGHYEAMRFWDRLLGRIRNNAAVAILGWSLSVAFIQPMAYTQAINRLGISNAMTGLFDFYKNFSDNADIIYEFSPYMQARTMAFDADLRNIMESDKDAIWKNNTIKRSYYALMSWTDKFVTLPTWWTAYNQELRESGDQGRAVEYADKIVRNTQSSGMAKDLAEVQRGSNARRIFVMFYSYFSSTYNELAKSHNMVASGKMGYSELMKSYWWLILLPALVSTIFRKGKEWPEKEYEEIMGDLAKGTLSYGLGTIPIINGWTNFVLEGYSFRPTPIMGLPEELGKSAKAFYAGNVPTAVKSGAMSIGYLLGIPSRQLVLAGETIWDAIDEGEIKPMNLIYAEQKKKR